MHPTEDVFAIPLWIDGRASLRVAPTFHEVRNPVTGAVLRKVPLCGRGDFDDARRSAQTARDAWLGLGVAGRRGLLAALADALAGLSKHFASILAEETGEIDALVDEDIACAVALLRAATPFQVFGVAVLSGSGKPFSAVVGQAVAALAGGATLIICADPDAPTVLFALAELSGRCGFPPGVVNVLYPTADVLSRLEPADDLVLLS